MDNLRVISKYGYCSIGLFGVIFLLSLLFDTFIFLSAILLIFVVFIYRNPERLPNVESMDAILSPIDGVIEDIRKSSYNGVLYTEVVIKNSIFDSGVLRAVANLKVDEIKSKNGLNLATTSLDKNLLNNRIAYICSVGDKQVIIRINSGAMSRKIHLEKTKELKAGRRFGFILDGRVSLFLPLTTKLNVSVGNRVKAADLIGFLEE
ncbi:phosphatidylserine decarboxylase [Campylobacter fetus]|uniref:Phosphatidylserine decarboxylase n=3 Tax=Campylobacter fetus TaxID=196 RepID=A0A5L9WRR5_CAMFE|nr:phosphatidylserine decarboxylase [Campylobacter fetus]OCS22690.1 phosphatidylserine decarboxylase [Campylobacter fetus subsp. venerealis cfvi97/532]OCS26883.1 phosphatidylserine decarboxylase [Campylobacter fetus subsp. venerealis cfvB10]OCS30016.1 phosphatidylserine decarboxylase [Campylobacter fetus subsp. venerealis LMG 6570 = CCUG 33900]OCS42623.1 phosphatidylserine decarboxylase [Campylobacter fetus subsp. venerealis cfvi02/298]ABK81867.1 phosphatidylserine decarboxylase [Campylobacter